MAIDHERALPACRICQSPTRDWGPIFHQQPTLVGGVPIDLEGLDFRLARCTRCEFTAKHPPVPEEKLLECYRQVAQSHWGVAPDPRQRHFDTVRDAVLRAAPPGRRILDIGCANGALLQYFGPEWRRFGVEPSGPASALAAARGVRILGRTIEDVPATEAFDAIVAVDVAEHIPDPLPFFERAAAHLRPGGALLIVTSDTGSWHWTLERSRFWYCNIAEHISFYSRRTMGEIAGRCGMRPVHHSRISHARYKASERAVALAKNGAFLAGFACRGLGVPRLKRLFLEHRAPAWLPAVDHMVHVMVRQEVPILRPTILVPAPPVTASIPATAHTP